ncbi:MAG: DNA-directed RNA polymerase subunit omega [Clostridia bacterium]|nr:DNA-directed RNA polymerase subunit omega [Clostridia bacterium]
MLYPSVQDLTNNEVNRYMLVIAAAKSARYVTYKQGLVDENPEAQAEKLEESNNEKAVSTAVSKLHSGEFKIIVE